MKVALVHDWLTAQRGGEQVLLRLARLFAEAPIYTLVHAPGSVDPALEARTIHTSWLQRWPGPSRPFRALLPAFYHAMRRFDLRGYDLIVSTSHCVAVAAPSRPGQAHLCYVHSPMRYLYDQLPHYLPRQGRAWSAPAARLLAAPLRWRDRIAGQGPGRLLANSRFVAERVRRAWQRPAYVVPPPVDVAYFARGLRPESARHGFVCVGAQVAYKRTWALVRWASATQAPLTVVGTGPGATRLRASAGPTVRFVAGLPRAALRSLLQGAEALLFAGEEDFGIAFVEALAAGCPVVAFDGGGVKQSVVEQDGTILGALFNRLDPAAIAAAVASVRARRLGGALAPERLQRHAQQFAPSRFDAAILAHAADLLPRRLRPAVAALWPQTGPRQAPEA